SVLQAGRWRSTESRAPRRPSATRRRLWRGTRSSSNSGNTRITIGQNSPSPDGSSPQAEDPEGRRAGRPPVEQRDEVRPRDQPNDREGARTHDPAVAVAAAGRGSGYRIYELPEVAFWIFHIKRDATEDP